MATDQSVKVVNPIKIVAKVLSFPTSSQGLTYNVPKTTINRIIIPNYQFQKINGNYNVNEKIIPTTYKPIAPNIQAYNVYKQNISNYPTVNYDIPCSNEIDIDITPAQELTNPIILSPNTQLYQTNYNNTLKGKKRCNCTKSQCLKLYCECFANGEFCGNCNCNNCSNNIANEDERKKAIKSILERNPLAFHPKIGKNTGENERTHCKGCNCRRSGCLKNYCECYEAKIACSNNCKCIGCKNCEENDPKRSFLFNSRSFLFKGLNPIMANTANSYYPQSILSPQSSLNDGMESQKASNTIIDLNTPYARPLILTTSKAEDYSSDSFSLMPKHQDKLEIINAPIIKSNLRSLAFEFPFQIITDEIIEAIILCMLTQLHEILTKKPDIDTHLIEKVLTFEYGQCLLRIIKVIKNTQDNFVMDDNQKNSNASSIIMEGENMTNEKVSDISNGISHGNEGSLHESDTINVKIEQDLDDVTAFNNKEPKRINLTECDVPKGGPSMASNTSKRPRKPKNYSKDFLYYDTTSVDSFNCDTTPQQQLTACNNIL